MRREAERGGKILGRGTKKRRLWTREGGYGDRRTERERQAENARKKKHLHHSLDQLDLRSQELNRLLIINSSSGRRTLGMSSPLLDPVKDLGMPAQAVGCLEDPMVLIREVNETGWDTLALEDGEGGETFGDGETVVLVAVDDQGGGLPVLDKVRGVPAVVVLTGLGVPWHTAVLIVSEEECMRVSYIVMARLSDVTR